MKLDINLNVIDPNPQFLMGYSKEGYWVLVPKSAGGGVTAVAMASALTGTDAAGRAALRAAGVLSAYAGTVANEAAMLAISVPLNAGDTVTRADTGTTWRYIGPGVQTLLASWRNEGAAATYATQAQAVAGTDNVAVMTALRVSQAVDPKFLLKADAVTASPIVDAGVNTLTRTAAVGAPTGYFNRPLISDKNQDVDPTNAVAGDTISVLNSSASPKTLTVGALTVTMSAGKAGEVAYNGAAWSDPNAAPAASASGVTVYKVAQTADVASNSAVETLLWEGLLSGLTAGAEIDIPFRFGGSGTGNKQVQLKVGGAAGATDGTQIGTLTNTAPTWFQRLSCAIGAGGTSVVGISGNIINNGATAAAPNPAVAMTAGADVRVKLTLLKSVAADVVNVQSGQVRVFA